MNRKQAIEKIESEIYESKGDDGFSEGFFGYRLYDKNGLIHNDGGFNSAEEAREVAEAMVSRIRIQRTRGPSWW
jgi:hypothetical protein